MLTLAGFCIEILIKDAFETSEKCEKSGNFHLIAVSDDIHLNIQTDVLA